MTDKDENIDKSVSDKLDKLISRKKDETTALKFLYESLFKKIQSDNINESTKTKNKKK